MPLNFNPYKSTYVDPGSVAISETLRTRFADNMKADDEFSQSIADMISLNPDEGAKAALEDKYRSILDERADKGDYENMGTQILRDARKFTTEYQPILQNAQTRASIVETLKARRDKGDITSGMFDDAMAEMDRDYAATGGVANEGSYNERQVAKFVNVNERIFDRIKQLDKDAVGGFEVNYLNLSPEEIAMRGGAGQLGVGYDPEATYTYKTKDGITKYVPQEDIQAAFNSIMEEPDVREFMLQDARYSVNKMEDEEVVKVATDQAADFRAQAEATTDEDMKRYYNESAAKIESQLQNPEGIKMDAVRGIVMEATYVNNQSPLFRTALAIPGVEQTGGSRILEYDKAWLSLNKDNEVLAFGAGVTGALQSNSALSGTGLNDKMAYRTKQQSLLNDMQHPDYYADTLPGVTFDQLSTMTEDQFKELRGGATKEEVALFRQQKNHQLEVLGELAAMDKLFAEAATQTGETEEVRLQNVMELSGVKDALNLIKQSVPGTDDATALNLLRAHGLRVQSQQVVGTIGGGALATGQGIEVADYDPAVMAKVREVLGGTSRLTGGLDYGQVNGMGVNDILREVNSALKASDEKLNDYMTEVSVREFTPTVYTNVPGMTTKGRAEVDRVYKGTNPKDRGEVFVSPLTGMPVAFDQFLAHKLGDDYIGKDGKPTEEATELMMNAVQTGNIMYNPANVGNGGGTLAVSYKIDIDGKTQVVEAQIPFANVDVPAITEYTSGTSYQFLRQASMQRNHGIEEPIVTVLRPGGERMQVKVQLSKEPRTITPLSGPLEGRIMSLEDAMASGGFIAELQRAKARIVAQ